MDRQSGTMWHYVRALLAVAILMPVVGLGGAESAQLDRQELAQSLADPDRREAAIKRVAAAPGRFTPVLLEWTSEPPSNVAAWEFTNGLIEALGTVKSPRAVPFLIDKISFRSPVNDPWLKAPEVVIYVSPSIKALLAIGKPAVEPLKRAIYFGRLNLEDRLAVVFTLSRMDAPEAQDALATVRNYAQREVWYSDDAAKKKN